MEMHIDMTTVNAAQTVFSLFYAITWGALTNVWPRWRAFDWSLTKIDSERRYVWRRCVLSVSLLNIVPILFFVIVFVQLGSWKSNSPQWLAWLRLFFSMLQPFFLIGVYWVWVAVVQRFRSKFYPKPLTDWYTLQESELQQTFAGRNFFAALLYMIIPIAALIFVSNLCS
jgi:hypothetical protein